MGERSAIEWCDSTANGQMGCNGCELWRPAKPHEPGAVLRADGTWWIRICYAGVQTENILSNGPRKGWPEAFDKPRLFPERIEKAAAWKDLTGTKRADKPWLDGMPRVIFFNDMGDTWTVSLPLDWLAPYLPIIARSPHIWLILTKRIDRALEFSRRFALPPNVWVGVSVTSPQAARVRYLRQVKAAVRFISYEPILQRVDPTTWFPGVEWVIPGGASGDQAPPTDVGVIRDTIKVCHDYGAAVFVKQLGSRPVRIVGSGSHPGEWSDAPAPIKLRHPKGGDWNEWVGPLADLRVREFPKVAA